MALRPKDSFQESRIETLGHRWVTCVFGACTFRLAARAVVSEIDRAIFAADVELWNTEGQEGGRGIVLIPGDTILIPSMTPYSVKADESCVTAEGTFWDEKTILNILAGLASGLDTLDNGHQRKLRAEVPNIVEEFFTIVRQ